MKKHKKSINRFKDVTAISFTSKDEGLLINFHGFMSEEDKKDFTEYLFRKINMSYQYISDFGRFFNCLNNSIGSVTYDENIEWTMELLSDRIIQKEQDYLTQAGFNIDLREKVKVEIQSIFHKDNLETFRKLIPYLKKDYNSVDVSQLIRFFNIDNKNLNYLLEYMIKHDTGWRRWFGNPCS